MLTKSSEWKGSSVWQCYLSKSFENLGTANLKLKLTGFPTSKCRHPGSKFSMFEESLPTFHKNIFIIGAFRHITKWKIVETGSTISSPKIPDHKVGML